MKLSTKLLPAVALLAGLNSAFADDRKEATIDLGKGAFKLTVSVPDFADGPYDYAKNPGPRVNTNKKDGQGFVYGEVMYNAPLGESGVVVYQADAIRVVTNGHKSTLGALAESQALSTIKDEGFEGRATKFDCPPVQIEGATAVCYKMSGDKIFDGKTRKNKYAEVLVSVSFANDTMGYTMLGAITEKNVAKFNADPSDAERSANKALSQLWKFHKVSPN